MNTWGATILSLLHIAVPFHEMLHIYRGHRSVDLFMKIFGHSVAISFVRSAFSKAYSELIVWWTNFWSFRSDFLGSISILRIF